MIMLKSMVEITDDIKQRVSDCIRDESRKNEIEMLTIKVHSNKDLLC